MYKNLILLGSTGSIGTQSLDVVRKYDINVVALSAHKNIKLLEEQIKEFKPEYICITDIETANNFEDKAKDAYDTYLNYLIREINNIPVFDYAYEHLKALHELKAKTIVITNRDIKFIDALDSNKKFKKILPHVSNIITADEIGSTKPSPKVINYVLNKLNLKNIKNEEIVFVGDSLADMNTALLYPCVPILLTETSSDITEEFLSENKNKIYVANTHKEIYEAIKKISE